MQIERRWKLELWWSTLDYRDVVAIPGVGEMDAEWCCWSGWVWDYQLTVGGAVGCWRTGEM
ncbi:hypothetical protein Pint_05793 [Pistacia integerrima]|uniref:Uncharacterized protein n=1 Tax=Pistacia integerrima TaxID=434235 RepID=A0ACC0Z386_9ROSI|nr:hypothetical protein Pint_05793 [Pistacia integerrima]